MSIRFYHKTRFTDGTKYLEWKNSKMVAVSVDESRKKLPWWSLTSARAVVASGDWIEKRAQEPKKQSHKFILTVKTRSSRKAAERAVLIAFAGRDANDGFEFVLHRQAPRKTT